MLQDKSYIKTITTQYLCCCILPQLYFSECITLQKSKYNKGLSYSSQVFLQKAPQLVTQHAWAQTIGPLFVLHFQKWMKEINYVLKDLRLDPKSDGTRCCYYSFPSPSHQRAPVFIEFVNLFMTQNYLSECQESPSYYSIIPKFS